MKNPALLVSLVGCIASVQGSASELFRTPPTQLPDRTGTGPYVEVATQFTRSSALQREGEQIDNRLNQQLNSSVTEVTLGYNFTRSFGVEVDAPFIYREYQRVRRSEVENDQTTGVGDIALMAKWTAVRFGEGEKFFGVTFSGGLKLPTGDSDRLQEEAEEPEEIRALVLAEPAKTQIVTATILVPRMRFIGAGHQIRVLVPRKLDRIAIIPAKLEERTIGQVPRDPIRGKDLAPGSGSVDGILAASLYTRWRRLFLAADARYTIRSEGAFDYRYSDTFQWSGGPGLYVMPGPGARVALQLICSGEVKDEDEFQGRKRDDTALTAVFLGPAISASWKDRFSVQVGAELPVFVDNSGLQVAPDFRLQGSVSWQF